MLRIRASQGSRAASHVSHTHIFSLSRPVCHHSWQPQAKATVPQISKEAFLQDAEMSMARTGSSFVLGRVGKRGETQFLLYILTHKNEINEICVLIFFFFIYIP